MTSHGVIVNELWEREDRSLSASSLAPFPPPFSSSGVSALTARLSFLFSESRAPPRHRFPGAAGVGDGSGMREWESQGAGRREGSERRVCQAQRRRRNSAGCHGEPVNNTLSHLAAANMNPFSASYLRDKQETDIRKLYCFIRPRLLVTVATVNLLLPYSFSSYSFCIRFTVFRVIQCWLYSSLFIQTIVWPQQFGWLTDLRSYLWWPHRKNSIHKQAIMTQKAWKNKMKLILSIVKIN